MQIIFQIIFILLTGVAVYLFTKKVKEIARNIHLGRNSTISINKKMAWNNVLLLAFGQKKMFKKPTVALLHFLVYGGFIIINIEMLEIILDGIFGTHRMFQPLFVGFYTFLINSFEVMAALVLISCAIFLIRRNLIKIKRLTQTELNGWPKTDANAILITEIILMGLFLKMNAADAVLHHESGYLISKYLTAFFQNFSNDNLLILERTFWWAHIIGIYGFLNYLPYSKHLHIVLAFPNAYYEPQTPVGEMENMPNIQNEVLYAMDPSQAPTEVATEQYAGMFGAKDIFDLSWKNLMDAYACTECGRCTAACPAHVTGKLLSPRQIMMKTRDRIEEVGQNINLNHTFQNDNKALLHDYITQEELRACTTCNACVEECPVSISPLSIITQLRRQLIMEESNAPQEWNMMFGNIENNFAPWKFSPDDRDLWVSQMHTK